jgi:hypothetical protein
MGGSAKRFSIEDEERVSGGELATGGWDLKRADCRWTARLIIEIGLEIRQLGVAGGQT